MKKIEFINGFYFDPNGNKWNSLEYTEEEAAAASKSLVNCKNCTDCRACIDCTNCTDCTDCDDCIDCGGCTNCRSCTNCEDCTDCSNCTDYCYKSNLTPVSEENKTGFLLLIKELAEEENSYRKDRDFWWGNELKRDNLAREYNSNADYILQKFQNRGLPADLVDLANSCFRGIMDIAEESVKDFQQYKKEMEEF